MSTASSVEVSHCRYSNFTT